MTSWAKSMTSWYFFQNSFIIRRPSAAIFVNIIKVLTIFILPYSGWGEDKKAPPTSFSPLTSTNVGISPQNFLTFSFNTFSSLVQNFKFVPSASFKLLNLNQDHPSPQKKRFFLSNRYKIEVMITFLIEMLQLPNFGHMNTSII